ncbi:MAG: hypothetical protein V3T23_11315 [Nitrososphaerales archaeon]
MFKRGGGSGRDDNVIKIRASFRRSGVKNSNLPMTPPPKEGVIVPPPPTLDIPFNQAAVTAFDRAFRGLFEQTVYEAERLPRIRGALNTLDAVLLREEVIKNLSPEQQMLLAKILSDGAVSTTRMMVDMGKLMMQIRGIVATFEGVEHILESDKGGKA